VGEGRREYIGQFGIGMLAAFMVADEIEVISRSYLARLTGDPLEGQGGRHLQPGRAGPGRS